MSIKATHAAASATIKTGAGSYWGARLVGGAALDKLTVFDNTSAAGRIIDIIETTAAGDSPGEQFSKSVRVEIGIHVALAGTPVGVTVWHE